MKPLSHEEFSRRGGKKKSNKKAEAARRNWQKAKAALDLKRNQKTKQP